MISVRSFWMLAALLAFPTFSSSQNAVSKPKMSAAATQKLNAQKLNEALFDATKAGNLALMEKVLKLGAGVNSRDKRTINGYSPSDKTPLFVAIEHKSLAAVRLLVSRGANVNAEIDDFDLSSEEEKHRKRGEFASSLHLYYPVTPLDFAAYFDQVEMVKLLSDAEATSWDEPTEPDSDVMVPQAFHLASIANALKTMPVLLDLYEQNERVKNAFAALWWAVYNQQPQMAKLLVAAGANREACAHSLEFALSHGDAEAAALLIDGCDLKGTKGSEILWSLVEGPWLDVASVQEFGLDPALLSPARRAAAEAKIAHYQRMHQGAAELIGRIAAKGADLDSGSTKTLLLLAIERNDPLFIDALLDAGANPNLTLPGSPSPLRFLASHREISLRREDTWASLSIEKQLESQQQIQTEMETRSLPIARALISKGADVTQGDNRFALGEAALRGNNSLVEFLLQHGANPNLAFVPLSFQYSAASPVSEQLFLEFLRDGQRKVKNQTPLQLAARCGYLEIAAQLLEAGANANARDSLGRNALHYLTTQGRAATILGWEQLLSTDQNLTRSLSLLGSTNRLVGSNTLMPLPARPMAQLSKWAREGDSALTKLLLHRGCDPNARDWQGRTPLRMALLRSDMSVVDALLSAGAEHTGYISLFDVIENGRREWRVLPALTKLRADLMEADSQELWFSTDKARTKELVKDKIQARAMRQSALARRAFLLHEWGSVDAQVVARLLQNGADINARNRDGLTPLMLAARLGQSEVVRELIKFGADLRAKDRSGLSLPDQLSQRGQRHAPTLPEEFKQLATAEISPWFTPAMIQRREAFMRHTLRLENEQMQQLLRSFPLKSNLQPQFSSMRKPDVHSECGWHRLRRILECENLFSL